MSKTESKLQERRRKQYSSVFETLDDRNPEDILFELTNGCNHKCFFCFNGPSTRRVSILPLEETRSILQQAYDMGVRRVGFYGTGEPFLVKDLDKRVQAANDIGYEYVYLTTNGSVGKDEYWEKVLSAGVHSLKFSINAGTKETYQKVHGKDDFEKVIDRVKFVSGLRREKGLDFYLAASCVNSSTNDDEIDNLRTFLEQYVDEFMVYGLNNQIGYMDNTQKSGMTPGTRAKAPCPMVFNRFHISAEGYLTACCEDYQNYLAIADLKSVPLKDAWEDPLFIDLTEKHLKKDLGSTLCESCINQTCLSKIKPLNDDLATILEK